MIGFSNFCLQCGNPIEGSSIPDFRSLLGQRLPDRDESLQHKSKEARPWKSQEGNQEEGGRVERGDFHFAMF